jgi:hypothetical protein
MVSVVQAFLFMALAMSYLSLAVADEHYDSALAFRAELRRMQEPSFSAEALSRFAVRTNAVQREGASTVSINHPLAAYFGRME